MAYDATHNRTRRTAKGVAATRAESPAIAPLTLIIAVLLGLLLGAEWMHAI